jgi:hypothetical protein
VGRRGPFCAIVCCVMVAAAMTGRTRSMPLTIMLCLGSSWDEKTPVRAVNEDRRHCTPGEGGERAHQARQKERE